MAQATQADGFEATCTDAIDCVSDFEDEVAAYQRRLLARLEDAVVSGTLSEADGEHVAAAVRNGDFDEARYRFRDVTGGE
jgi:hypothetical protein